MRVLIIILLITTVSKVAGQTNLNSFLRNVNTMNLPYTTEQGYEIREKKKILNPSDSLFIITKLNNQPPRKINRYGDSPFGQIDCEDESNCEKLKDIKEISILSFIKVTQDYYILHLEFKENWDFGLSFGALVSMDKNGKLIDWFFSDGSANGGNPHGNVKRDFIIQKDKSILIDESSWDDNTLTYRFKAKFEVVTNISKNNIDYSDGEFQLKNLLINY